MLYRNGEIVYLTKHDFVQFLYESFNYEKEVDPNLYAIQAYKRPYKATGIHEQDAKLQNLTA